MLFLVIFLLLCVIIWVLSEVLYEKNRRYYLDMLYLALKVFKMELHYLENNKPFWFQKKKLKEYQNNHDMLTNSIETFNERINEELENLSNLSDN